MEIFASVLECLEDAFFISHADFSQVEEPQAFDDFRFKRLNNLSTIESLDAKALRIYFGVELLEIYQTLVGQFFLDAILLNILVRDKCILVRIAHEEGIEKLAEFESQIAFYRNYRRQARQFFVDILDCDLLFGFFVAEHISELPHRSFVNGLESSFLEQQISVPLVGLHLSLHAIQARRMSVGKQEFFFRFNSVVTSTGTSAKRRNGIEKLIVDALLFQILDEAFDTRVFSLISRIALCAHCRNRV